MSASERDGLLGWVLKHLPHPVVRFTDPTGRKGIFIGIKFSF